MSHSDDIEARRRALYARRDELRAAQAGAMERRNRAEQIARFQRSLGNSLDSAGVRYEARWPWMEPRRGPVERYPIGFASIHWPLVPHAVSRFGGDDATQKELLDQALADLGIPPDRRVTVDWYVGGMPRLEMAASEVSAHALLLMRASHDTWIYDTDGSWVIEIYHEGEVTYAGRPGRAEHAGDGWRPSRRPRRNPAALPPEGEPLG